MRYVMLWTWKPGVTKEQMDDALDRRRDYVWPPDTKPIAEYWLGASSPAVVVVLEAPDHGRITEIVLAWEQRAFNITTLLAATYDEVSSQRPPREIKTW
jgi:hypothetical protein